MSDDVTRFREQCFLFVCNKLDSAEMAAMAAILARHPELGAEVAAERALVAQARAGLAASYQAAPPLLSYADMMAAVKADRASTRRGALARLAAWWNNFLSPAWASAALALLVLGVGVQTYRLEQVSSAQVDATYRGLPQQAGRPLLKVVFTDELSMGELRKLLSGMHLDIVSGPDEQGVVWLALSEGSAVQAVENLKKSKAVIDAKVVAEGR